MYDFEYINESIRIEQELFEMNCLMEYKVIVNEGVGDFFSKLMETVSNFFKWLWQKIKDFGNWVKGLFNKSNSDTKAKSEEVHKKFVTDGTGDLEVTVKYLDYNDRLDKLYKYVNNHTSSEEEEIKREIQSCIDSMNTNKLDLITYSSATRHSSKGFDDDMNNKEYSNEVIGEIKTGLIKDIISSLTSYLSLDKNKVDSENLDKFLESIKQNEPREIKDTKENVWKLVTESDVNMSNYSKCIESFKKKSEELMKNKTLLEKTLSEYRNKDISDKKFEASIANQTIFVISLCQITFTSYQKIYKVVFDMINKQINENLRVLEILKNVKETE